VTGGDENSSAGAILAGLVGRQKRGAPQGLYAACTASAFAMRAVLHQAASDGSPALIESTAAQVNLSGGYAGLTPRRFRREVLLLARRAGLAAERVILGGDHIGLHPWRRQAAEQAMGLATALAAACAAAGYRKLHLDTATPARDDPREADGTLPLEIVSRRAAALCRAAEEAARQAGEGPPWYVIGSDVPPPGGSREGSDPVPPSAVRKVAETVAAHRQAFRAGGLADAWERVFAVVVYSGADFGPRVVHPYDSGRAAPLVDWIRRRRDLVFEAHSTDFQTPGALASMVADQFGVLKVGPALTYVMREALFALAALEEASLGQRKGVRRSRLPEVMEALMLADPRHWKGYYQGSAAEQADLRRRAYSDRIRYYWFHPRAVAAVDRLLRNLTALPPPQSLIDRHLPDAAARIRGGLIAWDPGRIVGDRIGRVVQAYARACRLSAD
jgi:D-tagatose-1,6-bisphosphate aldolase subunit GatZ/KbaZ